MHLSISWLNTGPPADAISDLPTPTRRSGKLKCWNSRPKDAVDEGRELFEEHKRSAHPHIVE
jgi:hypothetical protein